MKARGSGQCEGCAGTKEIENKEMLGKGGFNTDRDGMVVGVFGRWVEREEKMKSLQ